MAAKKRVYLDYNASTPVDRRVVDAMLPCFTEIFGNASSDHSFGWDAQEVVEHSREQLSRLLNCKASELSFTSGATEAANLGLFGFCESQRSKGNHLITCKTEHKAILDTMKALETKGFEVTYLDVDSEGNIDLQELEDAIRSQTILVCLMLANNETGLLHPLQEIESLVHSRNVSLMSDITQTLGKIPVDLRTLNLDLAVFSSHKIYGPKGVGALFVKNGLRLDPHIFGGGQEKGIRPGSHNVPGVVGFGKAAEIAFSEMENESARIQKLRDQLETGLEKIEGVLIHSKNAKRLPNTSNVSFQGIDGNLALRRMGGLALSRGSACTSNTLLPSHVLTAMGLSESLALASFRISLGRYSDSEDVELAVQEMSRTVEQLKQSVI